MSLADKFFDRHIEESESVSTTVTDMRSLVSHSSNVHVLNVGPNSVVNYTAKEKDEDAPRTSEERLLPVLCVVQKPEGPVYSARKRTHEPDTDTDCRVLLGVKCDVNSKELMALSFSHSLSKGIVGTDLNDPSRNYLIDIDTITNVSTETQRTCRSVEYDKIMGRLELLGEEGRWQEFDVFAGQLVQHFETRDIDLKIVVVLERGDTEH
ncbi:Hypp7287 [Branchiostoma lanceolatum]|uniref:Hypp7287 protein n=1 Tax=Branchiostoma lanceolatum TaxID=7740 RepID=A0A8J9YZ18_BRALA|nr:Hypp7287 [Branchiostoma lanceolatum]